MKEVNETIDTTRPSEAEMNNMYKDAWLNFQADAQEARQVVNRRYANMIDRFGSYEKMPKAIKEILKDDYSAHKAKWGENGEEQQKRFGVNEPEPTQMNKPVEKQQRVEEQEQRKQDFLKQRQEQRLQQEKAKEYQI